MRNVRGIDRKRLEKWWFGSKFILLGESIEKPLKMMIWLKMQAVRVKAPWKMIIWLKMRTFRGINRKPLENDDLIKYHENGNAGVGFEISFKKNV